jgi:hypothetical protein
MLRSEQVQSTGEAGYFLTDAIVGLFVLAALAASLMSAFALARSLGDRADHSAAALVVARSCLEEGAFTPGAADLELNGVTYSKSSSSELIEQENAQAVELVRIACVVGWMDRAVSREVRLERVEVRARS